MNKLLLALPCLALTGCSPAPQPLPSGPPPEYEAPRVYDPDKNIDQQPTAEPGDDSGFGMMPPPPTAAPAPGPAVPAPTDTATPATSGEPPPAGSTAPATASNVPPATSAAPAP